MQVKTRNYRGSVPRAECFALVVTFVLALGFVLVLGADAFADPAPATAPAAASGAPTSVDLRPVFDDWKLTMRSQGARGTCSVFAITGALEYAWASKDHHGTRLSPEFLNWSSNAATGDDEDGSFFSDAWKGFAKYGICPEVDMPYQPAFDPARHPSEEALKHAAAVRDGGLRLHWIKRWNPRRGLSRAELLEAKRAIANHWPVCGGCLWPKQQQWKDNVLQMTTRDQVFDGHSILLVGYRDDPAQPGGGIFFTRNYAHTNRDAFMSYAYVRAYMNDAVWIDHDPAAEGNAPSPDGVPDAREPAAPVTMPSAELPGPLGPAPAGRNHRVSSNEQPKWNDGDDDMVWLYPGESVKMPVFEGPGVITHMWFTSHAGWANELDALVLRIYYDGSPTPGVEAPLGNFFAVGNKPAVVESVPVQVSPTGAMTCYWRMPFRKSARITVTNDNPDRSTGLYYQVDWTRVEDLPPDTPYFYAKYRQEYPAVGGRDYVLADLEGTGWYAGTVLSVTLAQDGWFGEGDDFFFIDGETVPSLQGTGSEDYFNDAWGFRPRTSHWFGQPRWQGDRAGDGGVAYRWHLPDPVHFDQSLKVAIEHKGNCAEDTDGFFLERPDFFNSVAFWYQTGEPKAWPELPAYPQRHMPWQGRHFVQAFKQAKVEGSGNLRVDTTGFFGARPVVVWSQRAIGDTVTFPFEVKETGRYALRLTAGGGPGQGACEVRLDGRRTVPADFHAEEESEVDLLLGTYELTSGQHTIGFKTMAGAATPGSSGSRSGPLTLEMLRMLRLPPEAKREVRGADEAHFVRLGIGRAVYAYRLAYGKLPDSLQALVDARIMPPKFLKDENGIPLKDSVKDGYFYVESTGQPGWKFRWQGLDARR